MTDPASFIPTQHPAAFPEHSGSTDRGLPEAIDAARRFAQTRFPGSSVTLLGGSWAHGGAHAESDLDLVVLDCGLKEIRFECLLFESWVVDVCSLPPRLMEAFFRGSAKYGNAPVPNKVLGGIIVFGDQSAATEAKLLARQVLSEGPLALDEKENLDRRWALTCLLIDLAHASDREWLGLAAQCHTQLAQAALDSARAWRGERKALLRALVATAPDLAERLDGALKAALQGDRTRLLGIGRQILEALGGYQRTYVESYLPAARPGVSSALVSVNGPLLGQGKVCELVLRALPQWFGIESATLGYIRSADELPSFVAYLAGEPVGIALVKRHFELSSEVYLMGVLPTRHRMGIGRALIAAIEHWLSQQGVPFLQVKTLSARSADASYARTRAFYLGMGFVPLEELPTLWSEHNPCLMLIKRVPEGD